MSDYTCFTEGCDKPSRALTGKALAAKDEADSAAAEVAAIARELGA
jgi:hypothetical protein